MQFFLAPTTLLLSFMIGSATAEPSALQSKNRTTLAPVSQDEPKPVTRKQLKDWTQEYLELGSRAMGTGRERQLEILEALASTPDLTPASEKKWRASLLKTWSKLPGLPFKKGDGHYWEKERKGRYIVGGKTKKAKGLLIAMHGGGVGQGDAGGAASMYSAVASSNKWTMIAPQVIEKTEHGWTDAGTEEWIWDLVEQARRTFKIDADHVFLAGHSMGGYGSWTLGAHHADRVAALAPSAGAPTPVMDETTHDIIDIDWGVVPSLRNVPMVVFQSRDDPQVPPGPNQEAARRVEAAQERWGGYEQFEYWELDGFGHGAPPGGPKAQFERLKSLTRQPIQDVVVWQPVLDWKRQFYWLHWEKPAPGAIVEARIDREQNRIDVTVEWHKQSEPGAGLSVLLDRSILDLDRQVTIHFNGKQAFQGQVHGRLETLLETSTFGDPGRQYIARIPIQ